MLGPEFEKSCERAKHALQNVESADVIHVVETLSSIIHEANTFFLGLRALWLSNDTKRPSTETLVAASELNAKLHGASRAIRVLSSQSENG